MDEPHWKDFAELSFSNQWQESFKIPMKKLVKALTVRIVDWNTWFNVQADATHISCWRRLTQLREGNIGHPRYCVHT